MQDPISHLYTGIQRVVIMLADRTPGTGDLLEYGWAFMRLRWLEEAKKPD